MTGPNSEALQVFYGTLPLIGAAVLAVWTNNYRLGELSKRLDDGLAGVNKRLDDSLGAVNKRLDDGQGALQAFRADVRQDFKEVKERLTDLEKSARLVR
jgi:tetrahydromethanopterin S-methyltransferase subunit G